MHLHIIATLLCLTTAVFSAPVTGSQGVNQNITLSCRDFKLLKDGHTLKAICLSEVQTEINTDLYLGINNGQFEWGMHGWWKNDPSNVVVWDDELLLVSGHPHVSQKGAIVVDRKVNLATHIKNVNGTLTYYVGPLKNQGVDPDITKSCRDFKLRDGHILTAVCLTEISTKIDTNKFLGVKRGKFYWDKNKWSKYASKVKLTSENGPVIKAVLKDKRRKMCTDSVKLDERIKNVDGKLTYHEYRLPTPNTFQELNVQLTYVKPAK